ncbi:sigma-54 interaction domain-containing protein [Oceanobacter mangrovi]|uniref:sigma-54 interaction domain-containing protein n=1 Tax=Oceanobacter mangrovi TaxID=2862510 RepID=UPI001C8DAA1B|nr:sigma-54 dependent transcriptional regulator [Oceanobacter mangrovi]
MEPMMENHTNTMNDAAMAQHENTVKGIANADEYSIDLNKINIVGESPVLAHAVESIHVFSQFDAPVLISGETGTGKELAARGLHYSGPRSGYPFIAVNCATLTNDLFNSELFGHKKGAFTDARQDKKGLLASAGKGTLFLDEIDSLSLNSQAALLRLLQESEYRPVGSEKTFHSDVRVIASANCDLQAQIDQGLFRQDLYYRLNILNVNMPALRQRTEDIPILVEHFLRQFSDQYGMGMKIVSNDLIDHFSSLPWPGNVRELENTIHRLYLLTRDSVISPGQFYLTDSLTDPVSPPDNPDIDRYVVAEPQNPDDLKHTSPQLIDYCDIDDGNYNFSRDKRRIVETFEKEYISRILDETNGNVTKAASLCGKDRRALGKMIKKYNIEKAVFMEANELI